VGGGAPRASSGVAAYFGGGVVRMRFRETSDFATDTDDVDQTTSGYTLFAGLELRMLRSVIVGAEAGYRRVPNAIGGGGISQKYNESDLGGAVFRFLIGIRR
jgi:opacity protein-like surface antigen